MKQKFWLKSHWIAVWWSVIICLIGLGLWATTAIHPHNSLPDRQMAFLPSDYKPDHYLFFNGDGSYGYIPPNQKMVASQFSISFWVRSEGPSNSSFDHPVEMLEWKHGVFYGWAFDVGNQSQIGNDKIFFRVGNTHGNLFGAGFATVSRDSWRNIVGTFDGTTLKLYQNGVLQGASQFGGPYSYPITLPIHLAVGFLPHHYWRGALSDILLYQRPLSQDEIVSIFQRQDVSNGLIGRWTLNEGSGNTIVDSSGNGNNGRLENPTWR